MTSKDTGRRSTLPAPNLTREEAEQRAAAITVDSYRVTLDLTDADGLPAEHTFRSRTEIRFRAAEPGSATFVDVIAENLHEVTLNGLPVDVRDYRPGSSIHVTGLAAENLVVVETEMAFNGGLDRFVDPLDGSVYLSSQFQTADAKRMYACFDQPSLKATFEFEVVAPADWRVATNGAARRTEQHGTRRTHSFETTAPISTYVTALVAGPYYVVSTEHDGIPMSLWCRQTLAENLDVDELFAITTNGFDWFHDKLGARYPFGKYDQIFAPEFRAGAMENAGCVILREEFLFRGRSTDQEQERRCLIVLHELAHMWFGNLTTMRWWDDLWLNESFATYTSVLCQQETTRWGDVWTTFLNVEKPWAYFQDQLQTTHPIATTVADIVAAESNFDGITYAKGASVLKQLGAYVGTEVLFSALRSYLDNHAFGSTQLSDLVVELEAACTRDLAAWSRAWIETSGINTIRPTFSLDDNGAFAEFHLDQEAPQHSASDNVLRPHRLALGLYDECTEGSLTLIERYEVDVVGPRTTISALVGVRQPALVVLNDDDLTYAKVRPDERSLQTLRSGRAADLDSALARAVSWGTLWDMTRDGELPVSEYLALVCSGAPGETSSGILQSLVDQSLRSVQVYLDPERAAHSSAELAEAARGALLTAAPGSDLQLVWARTLFRSVRTADQLALVADLLDGSVELPGLPLDTELRWSALHALIALGHAGPQSIDDELERDSSAAARRHAATARALVPTAEAKEATWQLLLRSNDVPGRTLQAVVDGFTHAAHRDLLQGYAARYFDEVGTMWGRGDKKLAKTLVDGLFPIWQANPETLAATDGFLASADLPTTLRRRVTEGRDELARAIAVRRADHDPAAVS